MSILTLSLATSTPLSSNPSLSAFPLSLPQLLSCSNLGIELLKHINPGQSISEQPLDASIKLLIPVIAQRPAGTPTDRLTFAELATLIENASIFLRRLPVVSFEAYQTPGKSTAGVFGHQYILVGVLCPRPPSHTDADPLTYIRLDMFRTGGALEGPCVLTAKAADDRAALAPPQDWRTSRFALAEGRDPAGGPSLDALAGLLRIVDARVARVGYGLLGRNCIWMNDVVLFSTLRRFADHWRANAVLEPEGTLRRYLDGEIGALAAVLETTVRDGTVRWITNVSATAMRWMQTVATGRSEDRFMMHDDEVADVVGKWTGFEPAVRPV